VSALERNRWGVVVAWALGAAFGLLALAALAGLPFARRPRSPALGGAW
jgi:hypothetical protein